MKNIYIFTRLPKAYAPQRLLKEIKELGHTGMVIDYDQVIMNIDEAATVVSVDGKELDIPDAVIFRAPGMDGFCTATRDSLLSFYVQKKVRVLNAESWARWSTLDKLTQHMEFQKEKIPFVSSRVYTDLVLLASEIKELPVVVKSYLGSRGKGVKKISKTHDLFVLDKEDAPFLVQPFLKGGRDVRVIILGEKALGAMLRVAKDGAFLTNFSAGGDVELFDLSTNPQVAEIAEKTAHLFKCEYAGVDLMQDETGAWRVLEINRSCQFEGFEQATGDNVAKKLLQYLLQ